MNSWNTFVKAISYGIKPNDRRLYGLRIALAGLIVTLIGLTIFLLLDVYAGQLIIAGGMVVGFLGVGLHFLMMRKTVKEQSWTDQE